MTLWTAALLMSFSLGGAVVSATLTTQTASAADTCNKNGSFLGFAPWYRGLQKSKTDCSIVSPKDMGPNGLSNFIWTIALNVIDDMLRLAGFICVGFIIYGGFKYMTSTGSSDGMSKAKTTILNAIIGLVISVLSIAIVNVAAGSFS